MHYKFVTNEHARGDGGQEKLPQMMLGNQMMLRGTRYNWVTPNSVVMNNVPSGPGQKCVIT